MHRRWHEQSYNSARQWRQRQRWGALPDIGRTIKSALAAGQGRGGRTTDQQAIAALVWKGVPQAMRVQVYMQLRGADVRQRRNGPGHVARLVKAAATETSSRWVALKQQVERDLPRTFSQHRTWLSTQPSMGP